MGILSFRAPALSLLVVAAMSSGAVQAAERLSMPFDCRFDGERVQMRPSEERSYVIFGRGEHEIYTACSPVDASRCRSWNVHRFDFDCGGVRVPWIDAAMAGARYSGREVWVEGGSFHLVMGPMWTGPRDRPSFGRGGWWRQRYMARDRHGADGVDARVVTLPPGYAPALGIPVEFSGEVDEVAQAPFATAVRAPASERTPETIPLPERAPRKLELQPAATPPPATPVADPAPAPQVAAVPHPAAPSSKDGRDVFAAKEPNAAPASLTTGSSAAPIIINGPRAAASEPPASAPAAPAQAVSDGTVDKGAEIRVAGTIEAPPGAVQETGTSASESAPVETASLPADRGIDQKTIVLLAAAAATLLALASFAVGGLWRRGPARIAPPATRDIASISLGDAPKGTALSTDRAAGPPSPHTPPMLPNGPPAGAAADEFAVPATYAEALEVLGASPDASLAAVKKIVDGLRQSWHPDLARSEPDRLHRQRRVQQINVAWDLVSQHRSAA